LLEFAKSLFPLAECERCGRGRASYEVVGALDDAASLPHLWVCADCATQALVEGRRVDRRSLVIPFHG